MLFHYPQCSDIQNNNTYNLQFEFKYKIANFQYGSYLQHAIEQLILDTNAWKQLSQAVTDV